MPVATLAAGEVGYLIAGIKDVGEARSGETVTEASRPAAAVQGYRDPKPMVFCGLYPMEGDDFADLREALEKMRLNDASVTYEPETSGALGFGFRCGFLGLLHMEIVRERLEREFDLSLIATAPSVEYVAHLTNGNVVAVDNPSAMPASNLVDYIEEPFLTVTVILPSEYTGSIMDLCQTRRGEMLRMEYLSPERLELVYRIPAGRGGARLLRCHEEPDQGLRQLGLRAVGLRAVRPGQDRHPAQRRAGRCVLGHRPQGRGFGVRAQDG